MQELIDKFYVKLSKEVVKKDGKLTSDDIIEIDKLIVGLNAIKTVANGIEQFETFKEIVKANS